MIQSIDKLIAAEGLPQDYCEVVEHYWRPLADHLLINPKRPLVVGINGAQGSGKTTLSRFLALLLAEKGLRTATLSLDDLYLTRSERLALAKEKHPLFATRGVPGTHDMALGQTILDALLAGQPTTLPRFDKATDDRAAEGVTVDGPVDVILIEGWCLGTAPQPEGALNAPVNSLEADEDPNGVWRQEINRRLATDYAEFFGRIDVLVMLEVEGFAAVRAHRALQEAKLAARNPHGAAIMDEAALTRFLMHYERLTRWTLEEMPARADVIFAIDEDQRPL